MSLTIFFILSLAAWRLASLVANEDGPWMIFQRLRQKGEEWCKKYRFCREMGLYDLIACEWCNSVWIGAGLTLLYLWLGNAVFYVALPFALSTIVILIKHVVQLLQTAQKVLEDSSKAEGQPQGNASRPRSAMDALATVFREKRGPTS